MSFKQINAFQPAAYITAIADDPDTVTLAADVTFSGTLEINMRDTDQSGDAIWLTSRNQILTTVRVSSLPSSGGSNGRMRIDPEFQITDAPESVNFVYPASANGTRSFIAGQFNPDTGDQLIINSPSSTPANQLRRMDIDTLVLDVGDYFVGGPNGTFQAQASSALAGNEGYWTVGVNGPFGQIFDGLTDGIPGETLSTGTNVYPSGLYLVNAIASHWNGVTHNTDGWIWVDIWTRNAVGRLGGGINSPFVPTAFPAETNSLIPSATNVQSEPPIGGDSFLWACRQYIPDGDATYIRPKGRLVFHSIQEIVPPLTVNDQKIYLRLTDFNPFGVAATAGQPERVHGRIRETSRWNLDHDPVFGLTGQSSLTTVSGAIKGMVFDPLRNRFVTSRRNNAISGSPASPFGQPTNTTVGFLSLQVDLANISLPVSLDVPRTGTIIEYITVLKGDIGEVISGQAVAWTLQRLSTEGEILNASVFPGTSTVANGPIDTNQDGTSILQLFADGSLLTLTTDYTVVASTGVITWVTDQSGASLVTATYEHRATPASPPHGTLITSSSESDTAGIARTTILYPDDNTLVGTLDLIGVVAI